MSDATPAGTGQFSKHRIEALIDGIFAVAMTLLVIDLKLPEHANVSDPAVLREALAELVPNLISWLISFMVLAIYWVANHRLYSHVRHADGRLVWFTMLMLAGASLLPFASAVNSRALSDVAQGVYAAVMGLMGLASLLAARHIYRHPQLCAQPMDRETYIAACVRTSGVIVIGLLTVPIAAVAPHMANFAFLLIFLLRPVSAAVARRWRRNAPVAHQA